MLILALDGPVENSWREIFDQTVKGSEYVGFEVGLTHDLRAVPGGTAVVGSLNLAEVEEESLDAKVKEVFNTLTDLVSDINKEDARRIKAVETMEASAMAWYSKAK